MPNDIALDHTQVEGQIISAHSYDRYGEKLGAVIELWIKSQAHIPSESKVFQLIIQDQRPVFFILESDLFQVQHLLRAHVDAYEFKSITLKSFQQHASVAVYASNLQYFYLARKVLQAVSTRIETFESDIQLHERFLMERFAYGTIIAKGVISNNTDAVTTLDNVRIKPTNADVRLTTLSIDIECSAEGELFSIGFHSSSCSRVIMIASGDDKPYIESEERFILCVDDEKALLRAMVAFINEQNPDVIIGWNVINFDFRLLFKRAALSNIDLTIGRDGSLAQWRDSRVDAQDGFVSIKGRVVIDGIDALKAETYHFPSFSLQSVSEALLGEGKLVDDSYSSNTYDALAVIENDFKYNKIKLARYNLHDCSLVTQIFEKTKVLDFLKFRSKLTGLPLDKRGGSVAAFTNLYLPKLHRAGYIAPNLPANGGLMSPGGYVMDSKPGLYKNVLVLDFKSLYPSIIRTFKIDPLGLIEGLIEAESNQSAEPIEGFKGAYFSRDKHFLPELISTLWQQRDVAKQDNDKPKSNAIKIIMNSFYGVLGSGGCRFYDSRLASSITLRGHQIMQQTSGWIEAMGHEVIYGDTDSIFVALDENYSTERCQTIGLQLAKEINNSWQEKCKQEFQLTCYLELEFETHYSRFLMPKIRGLDTGSKKRYAGLVASTSKSEEQLIFKGLETVRTDWTDLARQFQYRLIDDVFHDRSPEAYIKQTVFDTINGKLDNQLIYRKRLRKPLNEYRKNIPPHAQAALKADSDNAKRGEKLRYQSKAWIEYVLTMNGPEVIEQHVSDIDYEHYVIKQLQVIADGVLPFIGLSFEELFKQQLDLF